MSRIAAHLFTGCAFLKTIIIDDFGGDLMRGLDEYYYENGEFPVEHFTMEDVEESRDDGGTLWETAIAINGGEFFIEGISHIEKVEDLKARLPHIHIKDGVNYVLEYNEEE